MREEKNKRIFIASVLKPVDDTRMFGKIARTLAEANKYEVHVMGSEPCPSETYNVTIYPLQDLTRWNFERMAAPWKVLKKVLQVRPGLFIITTHELLFIAMLARLLTKCAVIYDVQENYFLNILHTNAFPKIVRPLIASYVRMKELIAKPFVKHFLLAENTYELELPFIRKSYTTLLNKVRRPTTLLRKERERNKLLFTGTLAETTGVLTAIDIGIGLHQLDPAITLTIIGHCAKQDTLNEIKRSIAPFPFIKLITGESPVPHHHIIEQICQADLGIISYPFNPSTSEATPTKLYEYLGYHLPIILINHKPWVKMCDEYDAAVVFEPSAIDFTKLHSSIKTFTFYTKAPEQVYWESEEKKLLQVVSSIL